MFRRDSLQEDAVRESLEKQKKNNLKDEFSEFSDVRIGRKSPRYRERTNSNPIARMPRLRVTITRRRTWRFEDRVCAIWCACLLFGWLVVRRRRITKARAVAEFDCKRRRRRKCRGHADVNKPQIYNFLAARCSHGVFFAPKKLSHSQTLCGRRARRTDCQYTALMHQSCTCTAAYHSCMPTMYYTMYYIAL